IIGGPLGKDQAIALGVIFVGGAFIGRRAARRLATRASAAERCLFIGHEVSYRRLATAFTRHDLPSVLVGYAPIEQVLDALRAAPRDEVAVLRELVAAERAHRIIIGPHAMSNTATFELVDGARRAGARVSLLPDMLEVVGSSVDFDDLYGITLLGVRHSQLSRSSKLLKRSFDVAGAVLLLILAAPLMAMIAIAIRIDSRGPILFRQWRIGRVGKPFQIVKFRTMIPDADALKDGLRELNEAEGLFKITDDPRITHIGRALRRTSLDELPQLFNVLLGQMSLVGPRPLVADEDGCILGAHRERLRLTPGMTGPWQVSGSARIPLEDMVKLDHLYVSNWTLWADLKILLRTVPFVFGSRGL
ncbi:MAG TPA: exopolysaccharide biosynthesis polyprenyl glycosylphosphotransferase, partial [Solirubrobacteraceae bacterium]|nr:exopolysaccharide biosynthesis polyprenyl glycosylphosphotransferase [Solirubrobacteraceae bacterium]